MWDREIDGRRGDYWKSINQLCIGQSQHLEDHEAQIPISHRGLPHSMHFLLLIRAETAQRMFPAKASANMDGAQLPVTITGPSTDHKSSFIPAALMSVPSHRYQGSGAKEGAQ